MIYLSIYFDIPWKIRLRKYNVMVLGNKNMIHFHRNGRGGGDGDDCEILDKHKQFQSTFSPAVWIGSGWSAAWRLSRYSGKMFDLRLACNRGPAGHVLYITEAFMTVVHIQHMLISMFIPYLTLHASYQMWNEHGNVQSLHIDVWSYLIMQFIQSLFPASN